MLLNLDDGRVWCLSLNLSFLLFNFPFFVPCTFLHIPTVHLRVFQNRQASGKTVHSLPGSDLPTSLPVAYRSLGSPKLSGNARRSPLNVPLQSACIDRDPCASHLKFMDDARRYSHFEKKKKFWITGSALCLLFLLGSAKKTKKRRKKNFWIKFLNLFFLFLFLWIGN